MAAAVVPLAVSAGSAIYKHYANKRAAGAQSSQAAALTEGLASARQAREQGGSLFGAGMPLIQSAGSYWQKLLNGDKNALRDATATERGQIEESALGASRGISAGPLRGGARDYAQAELARTKFGLLGGLVPAARSAAAGQVGNLGVAAAGAGAGQTGNAAGLFTSLYGSQEAGRQFDTKQKNQTGDEWGTLISNLLAGLVKGGGGGGGKALTANTSPMQIGRTSPGVYGGVDWPGVNRRKDYV